MNRSSLLATLTALALASGLSVTEVQAQVDTTCALIATSGDIGELRRIAFNPSNAVEAACSDLALQRLLSLTPPAAGGGGGVGGPFDSPY